MQTLAKLFQWLVNDSTASDDTFIDDKVLFAAICLLAIGLIMVYSASIAYAAHDKNLHNQYYYLIRHAGYLAVGIIAGIIVFNAPTSFWRRHATTIAIIVALLLIAVLIPHLGRTVNGSKRWIGIGLLNLQPSELAKLGMAIYLANYVCGKSLSLKRFWTDICPVLLVIGLVDTLLLLEPDMGSATVVFIIALGVLFMADIDKKIILGLSSIGVFGFAALIVVEPYRMRRVLGFIDPWQDALGKGYQLTHSLLAVGHGGWFGVGV
ncbi:MAG: FtsW/RodA/SpoVE family cell cycle protein, partial [Burkholderiales bacterium]